MKSESFLEKDNLALSLNVGSEVHRVEKYLLSKKCRKRDICQVKKVRNLSDESCSFSRRLLILKFLEFLTFSKTLTMYVLYKKCLSEETWLDMKRNCLMSVFRWLLSKYCML